MIILMHLKCSLIFYAIISRYKCLGHFGYVRDSGLGFILCSLFSSKSDWNRTAYKRVNYNAAVANGQFHRTNNTTANPKPLAKAFIWRLGSSGALSKYNLMANYAKMCTHMGHTRVTLGPYWGT